MILSDKLTPRDIETILNRLGIEPKGADSNGWTTIKSPLREERNPSFSINLKTGAWKDHGTDESGDLVTLAERMNRMDTKEAISWIKKQTDLSGPLYRPSNNGEKMKEAVQFWTPERIRLLSEAQTLKENPDHPLIQQAKQYDCLTLKTLQFFGVGIIKKWSSDWLAFPYETGCQLYRREDGKVIRSLKGSSPGQSFFGSRKITGNKDSLYIAKSPRECMLLAQTCGDRADAVGIATGEQGKVSRKQIEALRDKISGRDYENIYVFLDCDSEAAKITAESFTGEIAKALERKIKLVNIHAYSGGTFKDVADCMRAGMDQETFTDMLAHAEPVKYEAAPPPEAEEKEGEGEFNEVAPWPEPVDGSEVARQVIDILDRYLVLREHTPEVITLWILFTYVYDNFDCCPILAITSPEKRCGKTSLLAFLIALCQKPLSASNITPAATFRAIEEWHPTLIVDEADTFLKNYDELKGILNSGHTRATAYVTRAVPKGKSFDVQRFSTWTPKAIALIGKLTDTLADRSIKVKMRRKKEGEQTERIPYSKLDKQLKPLRRKIARWATDATFNYDVDLPGGLDDRAIDNWIPLLSIAENIGWGRKASKAAVGLSGRVDTDTYRTELLSDIHEIFDEQNDDKITTADLLDKLRDDPEKPWVEFNHGNPITAHKLASMLRPFEISSTTLYTTPRRKGYKFEDFKDAFDRYVS